MSTGADRTGTEQLESEVTPTNRSQRRMIAIDLKMLAD